MSSPKKELIKICISCVNFSVSIPDFEMAIDMNKNTYLKMDRPTEEGYVWRLIEVEDGCIRMVNNHGSDTYRDDEVKFVDDFSESYIIQGVIVFCDGNFDDAKESIIRFNLREQCIVAYERYACKEVGWLNKYHTIEQVNYMLEGFVKELCEKYNEKLS